MSGRLTITATRSTERRPGTELCLTLEVGDVTVDLLGGDAFWHLVRTAVVDSQVRSPRATDPEELCECRALDGGLKLVSYPVDRLGREAAGLSPYPLEVVARVRIADGPVEVVAYGAVAVADGLGEGQAGGDATGVAEGPTVVWGRLQQGRGPSGAYEIAGQCPRCGGDHLHGPAPKIAELVAGIVGETHAEANLLAAAAAQGVAPDEGDVGDARAVGGPDAACDGVRAIDVQATGEGEDRGGHNRERSAESGAPTSNRGRP